ncbi:MAG: PTS glucose transporter subunit IIA, partial [Lachnospiraceae bacterium]|nr:PTS glucose transporter subunit IIA [Lachnospiraceae bacterium]
MFSFFKKKDDGIVIASPIKGKAISITEVSDPTFSECMLGKGIAIIPEEGKVCSPVDGEVSMEFETLHAVSLTS